MSCGKSFWKSVVERIALTLLEPTTSMLDGKTPLAAVNDLFGVADATVAQSSMAGAARNTSAFFI
jgi:hypothetical protein